MKPGFKKLFLVVTLVVVALAFAGCANTLIGEGGPDPAKDMYGVWKPSSNSADASNTYKFVASGNGSYGSSTFTWRVDPEAKDPYKIIMVDANGKETIKAFTYEDDKLTIYEGETDSGKKSTYSRSTEASPANGTLPKIAWPDN